MTTVVIKSCVSAVNEDTRYCCIIMATIASVQYSNFVEEFLDDSLAITYPTVLSW